MMRHDHGAPGERLPQLVIDKCSDINSAKNHLTIRNMFTKRSFMTNTARTIRISI